MGREICYPERSDLKGRAAEGSGRVGIRAIPASPQIPPLARVAHSVGMTGKDDELAIVNNKAVASEKPIKGLGF